MYLKIISLILSIFLFACVYFFLDDSHFSGINVLNEAIRDEILKRNATKQLKENFLQKERKKQRVRMEPHKLIDINIVDKNEEDDVKKSAIDIKTQLKDVEMEKAIKTSVSQKFLDRLYFSVVTGTTVGYGDIYPRTNICRIITLLQLIISISIVFF